MTSRENGEGGVRGKRLLSYLILGWGRLVFPVTWSNFG